MHDQIQAGIAGSTSLMHEGKMEGSIGTDVDDVSLYTW